MNFSWERRKWDIQMKDPLTLKILEDDARYFLHQSMSIPCLDVLDKCKGSGMTTISGKYLLDFHGNNVHQIGYGNVLQLSPALTISREDLQKAVSILTEVFENFNEN